MERSRGFLKWAILLIAVCTAVGWLPLEVATAIKAFLLTQ